MRKSVRFLFFTLSLFFVIPFLYLSPVFPEVPVSSYKTASAKLSLEKIAFEIKRDSSASIQVSTVTAQSAKRKMEWGKIRLDYISRLPWTDEVQVKIWVLLFNREGKKRGKLSQNLFTVLTETSSYLNVPEGKGNSSVYFIHPDTLNRYGEVKQIHVELWSKGILESKMDQIISKKNMSNKLNLKDWWMRFQPINSQLFLPLYTPFAFDKDNPSSAVKLS